MRPRGRKLRCAAPGPSRICTRLTHTLRPRCRVGAWNGAAMGTATALIAVPQQPSPDPNIHGDKAVDSRPRGGKAVKGADKLPGKAPTLCVCVCVCVCVRACMRAIWERGEGVHTLRSPSHCIRQCGVWRALSIVVSPFPASRRSIAVKLRRCKAHACAADQDRIGQRRGLRRIASARRKMMSTDCTDAEAVLADLPWRAWW
mmetsp:Transcript_4939/g.12027  ORF Transcript_4939/g.12027 Transcript_4939/m.12027 type:complete len:202 (-) Transcript_4939:1942-2547(-)